MLQPKDKDWLNGYKNKTPTYVVYKRPTSKQGDLNQIPYNYTVEVRNGFKGLDLIDRVPEELWTEVWDIVQETETKTIPTLGAPMQVTRACVDVK